MRELTAECRDRLEAGDRALDVVEYAVAELELSGMYVAGRGSAPNTAGYVELDASIMDGGTRDAGAVAAVVGVVNPVIAARHVMEHTPHVMLVSKGAREFATRQGLARRNIDRRHLWQTRGARRRFSSHWPGHMGG